MPSTKTTRETARQSSRATGKITARSGSSVLDRTAPSNIEAEEGLLASCILDGGQEIITTCIEAKLEAVAFFKPAHQIIFSALLELYEEGSEVDEIILVNKLQNQDQLDEIGGFAAISSLTNRIETTAHARFWLEIVREKWMLRRLIRTANHVVEQCYEQQEGLEHFLEDVEQEIFKISQDRVTESAQPIKKSIDEAVNLVTKILQHGGEMSGVPTGLIDLDTMTFGFHKQEMIVLAARPSLGKTAMALNIAESVVMAKGDRAEPVPTLFFSIEMSAQQLALRLLCSRARVDLRGVREGFLQKEPQRALAQAAQELKTAPLWIDDSGNLTILELRAKARRVHTRRNLGLVIIDYLQLLSGTDTRVQREQQISEISRGIKAMAKELNLPVLVLSQLNREAERERRDPRLSDLRESGSIEQDADVVLLLTYPRPVKGESNDLPQATRERNLFIAKQRNGPVGTVPLTFIHEYTRFENYSAKRD